MPIQNYRATTIEKHVFSFCPEMSHARYPARQWPTHTASLHYCHGPTQGGWKSYCDPVTFSYPMLPMGLSYTLQRIYFPKFWFFLQFFVIDFESLWYIIFVHTFRLCVGLICPGERQIWPIRCEMFWAYAEIIFRLKKKLFNKVFA